MICKKQTDRWGLLLLLIAFVAFSGISVYADDIEAQDELKKAKVKFADADYYGAGNAYRAAELYADSADIKFQALTKAAEAFGKADKKYKQFQCLEDLIAGFPDKINFTEVIDEEYKIGNDFEQGHRDIPLSWMPWIKDSNRAPEIYKTILKQAPFAKFAPALKLKLGRIYLEEEKNEQALRMFRRVIKQHPKTKEAKYARFELANALVQLSSKAGDGDGAYAREAEAVLKETLKIYPKDPETLWINQSMRETDDVRSERLYKLAEFYQSRDNPEAAKRYFNDLISRFPDCKYAKPSEEHLKELDEDFKPHKIKKRKPINLYPVVDMKSEREIVLVAPEASGGKWLLPIDDLDLDSSHADEDYMAEKKAKEEAARKAREKRAAELAAKQAAKKRLQEEQLAKKRAAEALKKKEETEKEAKRLAEIKKKAAELQKAAKKQAEAKKAAEAAAKKKQDAAKAQKAAAEAKAQKGKSIETKPVKKEQAVDSNAGVDIQPDADKTKQEGSIWKYIIPIILLILLIAVILMMYAKKKKQV